MYAITRKYTFHIFAACLFIFGACSSNHSYAAVDSSLKNAWIFGLGLGGSKINLSNSTSVYADNGVPASNNMDTYTIKSPTSDLFQVLFGYRWFKDQTYLPYRHLYFQYRHYISSNIRGTVDQFALPEFENYTYQMHYDADLYLLSGKLDLISFKDVMPYLSGGLGLIANHLSNYSEAPTPNVTPRTSPDFKSRTTTNFAATLGAGIDFAMTDTLWLTLGYDHVFQSEIKTKPGTSTWYNTNLDFGNAGIDTVFLNLTANLTQVFGG